VVLAFILFVIVCRQRNSQTFGIKYWLTLITDFKKLT